MGAASDLGRAWHSFCPFIHGVHCTGVFYAMHTHNKDGLFRRPAEKPLRFLALGIYRENILLVLYAACAIDIRGVYSFLTHAWSVVEHWGRAAFLGAYCRVLGNNLGCGKLRFLRGGNALLPICFIQPFESTLAGCR